MHLLKQQMSAVISVNIFKIFTQKIYTYSYSKSNMITKIQRYLLIGLSMMIIMQLFPSQKIEWKDSMLFSLLCVILIIAFDTSCMANNNYKYENYDNVENFEFASNENFPEVKEQQESKNKILDEPQFQQYEPSASDTPSTGGPVPKQPPAPKKVQFEPKPVQQQNNHNAHNNQYVRKDDLDRMVDKIISKLNDSHHHTNNGFKKKSLGDYIDKSWPQTQEEQQYNLLHTDNWTPSRAEMVRAKTGDCEVCPVTMYNDHLPVLNFDNARKVLGNDIDEYRKRLD